MEEIERNHSSVHENGREGEGGEGDLRGVNQGGHRHDTSRDHSVHENGWEGGSREWMPNKHGRPAQNQRGLAKQVQTGLVQAGAGCT